WSTNDADGLSGKSWTLGHSSQHVSRRWAATPVARVDRSEPGIARRRANRMAETVAPVGSRAQQLARADKISCRKLGGFDGQGTGATGLARRHAARPRCDLFARGFAGALCRVVFKTRAAAAA